MISRSRSRFPHHLLASIVCLVFHSGNGTAQTVLPIDKMHVRFARGEVKKTDSVGNVATTNQEKTTVVNDPAEYPGDATVRPGGKLSTGADATAVVVVPGGGAFKMGPNTEVSVPANGGGGHSLELIKGRLFFDISAEEIKKRGNASFRLKTPTALLAVKGTQFFADSDSKTDVVGVHEGSVGVFGTGSRQVVTLAAGTAVPLEAGTLKPITTRPLTQGEVAWRDQYGVLKGLPFYCINQTGTGPPEFTGYITFDPGRAVIHLDFGRFRNGRTDDKREFVEGVFASIVTKKTVNDKTTWAPFTVGDQKTESTLHRIDKFLAAREVVTVEAVKFEIPLGNLGQSDLENGAWLVFTTKTGPDENDPNDKGGTRPVPATTFIGGRKRIFR